MSLTHWLEKYFVWLALPFVASSGYFLVDGALRLQRTRAPLAALPVLVHPSAPQFATVLRPYTVVTQSRLPISVAKLSGKVVQIDRASLDAVLEDRLSVGRLVPETRDGQVIGLRLFGIKPGSPLSTLGLMNGDRIEAINGYAIGTPEQALEAYGHLRTATTFNIALERRGSSISLTIHIRD